MKRLLILAAALCLTLSTAHAQSGGLLNATHGFPVPNDGTTGTILFGTAKINSAGNAIAATTADVAVPIYIVIGGAGTTGNAVLAAAGTLAPCTMDSNIVSGAGGYYVVNSTTTNNECHAQAAAPAAGVFPIGFIAAQQSTVAGSTALVHVPGEAPGIAQNGGSITQNTVAVPELQINGTNNVTGTNFTWTKSNEPVDFAWLGPTYGAIPNIVQWQHSFCIDGTSQNTCTVKFASNPNNLSAVLLFVNTGNTVTMNNGGTVTDTLLNTYTEVAHNGGSGGGTEPYIFAACGITGGAPDTLTFTAAAGGAVIINLEAVEIYGAPATNCFDQAGFSTSSLSVSTSGSVAQASEQVVAMFTNNDTTSANVVFSAGSGYTLFDQTFGCNASCSSAHQTLVSEGGNASTGLSGAQTATANVTGSTTNLAGMIATVKLTTAGGAPFTPKPIVIQNLPVATFTPTSGDCVSWLLVDSNNYQFNDGGPCQAVAAQNVVTGARSVGGVFQNTGGKPLYVAASIQSTAAATTSGLTDSSNPPTTTVIEDSNSTVGGAMPVFFIVLPGNFYKVTVSAGTGSVLVWTEWQ